MLNILEVLGLSFIGIYALWLFYLAVMTLERARNAGTLTPAAKAFGYPILYIGLFIDFVINVTVLTAMFFELPQEWLVTSRLKRHKSFSTGWRHTLAVWYCTQLLDMFDPSGCHC